MAVLPRQMTCRDALKPSRYQALSKPLTTTFSLTIAGQTFELLDTSEGLTAQLTGRASHHFFIPQLLARRLSRR